MGIEWYSQLLNNLFFLTGRPLLILDTEKSEGTSVVQWFNFRIINIISKREIIPKTMHKINKKWLDEFKDRSIKKNNKVNVQILAKIE